MKVLMSNVDRKTAYQIIGAFYEALGAMNYPVSSYRTGELTFVDVDEGFKKQTIYYDGAACAIRMR